MAPLTDIEMSAIRHFCAEAREACLIYRGFTDASCQDTETYTEADSSTKEDAAPFLGSAGSEEVVDAQIEKIRLEKERWAKETSPITPHERAKRMLICAHYILLINIKQSYQADHVHSEFWRQYAISTSDLGATDGRMHAERSASLVNSGADTASAQRSSLTDDGNLISITNALSAQWPSQASHTTSPRGKVYPPTPATIRAPKFEIPDASRKVARLLSDGEREAYAVNPESALGKMFEVKFTIPVEELNYVFADADTNFFKVHSILSAEGQKSIYLIFSTMGATAFAHEMGAWKEKLNGNKEEGVEVYEVTVLKDDSDNTT